jgi:hypothetical protein
MESRIAGIPCRIEVLDVFVQKPNLQADNPDDYYGYTEIDFGVCDRRGHPALWLEAKMTDDDRHRIETEILERA